MSTKELKAEARQKLPFNMHLAVGVYAIEFFMLVSVIAIVVMASIAFATATQAAEIAAMYPPTTTITDTVDGQGDENSSVQASASEGENAADAEVKKPKVGIGSRVASVLMIVYGVLVFIAMMVMFGIINFSLIEYYLATYRCIPYGVRGMGESLTRGGLGKVLVLNFRRTLFGFLLLLCLIVPGVIYLIRTSMANHLLVANPKMKAKAVLAASNKVMIGKSGGYFTLMISFIGWYAIGLLTLGLGFIFIMPYVNLTKTVYYKRNLQGDRTVYNLVMQSQGGQQARAYAPQQAMQQPQGAAPQAKPAQPEQYVSPIDTMDADDYREMNNAMRDVNGDPEPVSIEDIPEVPIFPTAGTKSNTPEKNMDEPHKLDGSDIVESVREMTSVEVGGEAETYERKLESLYNGGGIKSKPARNYFGTQFGQSQGDFVTSEVQGVDVSVETAHDADAAQKSLDDDFADFLKHFDADTASVNQSASAPEPEPVNSSAQTAPANPADSATESRADRLRREREERIRKLMKK